MAPVRQLAGDRRAWLVIVIVAIVIRTVGIDHWPGLNGDEAWYGVNIQLLLSGQAPYLVTPSSNPINPLHSAPLLLLSWFLEPSTAVLRLPEVAWGVVAVAIAYPLLVVPLGRRAALLVTMFMAISPTTVAYARFGWDPSGTPLVALLVLGFALRNRPGLMIASLGAAVVVHPTNVFLAPIALAVWAPHGLAGYRGAAPASQRVAWYAGATIAVALSFAALLVLRKAAANPNTALPSVEMALARAISPAAWLDLAGGVLGLYSGVTTVWFIAGPLPDPAVVAAKSLAAMALLLPIGLAWREFWTHRHAPWLLAGIGASLLVFHVVAGPAALRPGFERYALFLVVPLILLSAIAIDSLVDRQMVAGWGTVAVTCAAMATTLSAGYFYPLVVRGGDAATAFRTAVVEPKWAAYDFVRTDSRSARSVEVVAEDWWIYWPLRYFAGPASRIRVSLSPTAAFPGGLRPPGDTGQTLSESPERAYAVAFAGGQLATELSRTTPAVFTVFDPAGRPVLYVFGARPASAK